MRDLVSVYVITFVYFGVSTAGAVVGVAVEIGLQPALIDPSYTACIESFPNYILLLVIPLLPTGFFLPSSDTLRDSPQTPCGFALPHPQ